MHSLDLVCCSSLLSLTHCHVTTVHLHFPICGSYSVPKYHGYMYTDSVHHICVFKHIWGNVRNFIWYNLPLKETSE